MPRLFRESPINTIWEGSGNVQCLDMLRAMQRNPGSLEAFMSELYRAEGKHPLLDQATSRLAKEFESPEDIEYRSRIVVGQMALAFQGAALYQAGNEQVAEAFCESRLRTDNAGWVYGCLPGTVDCASLIARATPEVS